MVSNEIVEASSPRTEGSPETEGANPIRAKRDRGRRPSSLNEDEARVSSRLAVKAKTDKDSLDDKDFNPCLNPYTKKFSKVLLIAQERAYRKATNERIKEEKLAADKSAKETQKVLKDKQAAIKREVDKAVKQTTASVTKAQQQHFKEEKEQRDQEMKRLEALVTEQAAELLSLKKAGVISHTLSHCLSHSLRHVFLGPQESCRGQIIFVRTTIIIKTANMPTTRIFAIVGVIVSSTFRNRFKRKLVGWESACEPKIEENFKEEEALEGTRKE